MCSSRLLRQIFERFASNGPDQVSLWHFCVSRSSLNCFFSPVFVGLFKCSFHHFCTIANPATVANITKSVIPNLIVVKVKSF
jgi:hypothetical protein